jgi:Putative GTP-binding controlling metal-binding
VRYSTISPIGLEKVSGTSNAGDLAMLRQLDRRPFTGIAAAPILEHGLGRAINDRLRRAVTPPTPTFRG